LAGGAAHWSLCSAAGRAAGQSPLRCRPTALGIAASGGLTSGFAHGDDILTIPEVIRAQTLHFKPNFKFSRLKMFWGDPRPSFGVRYHALVNL